MTIAGVDKRRRRWLLDENNWNYYERNLDDTARMECRNLLIVEV